MALRELAGDRVRVSLVAASEDFVERPMSVAEPFGLGTVRRYPLREIAADFGARFVHAAAIGVDAREPRLVFADGATLAGSTLILAPGARTLRPVPSGDHVRTRGCRRGRARARGRPRARRGPARGVRGAEPGRLDAAAVRAGAPDRTHGRGRRDQGRQPSPDHARAPTGGRLRGGAERDRGGAPGRRGDRVPRRDLRRRPRRRGRAAPRRPLASRRPDRGAAAGARPAACGRAEDAAPRLHPGRSARRGARPHRRVRGRRRDRLPGQAGRYRRPAGRSSRRSTSRRGTALRSNRRRSRPSCAGCC